MTRGWQLGTGLALTALAGYVDALGFVRLGGLYTSFMSGNTTQFAVSLGHGAFQHALAPAALIGAFLLGAVLGSGLSIVVPARWSPAAVLAYESLLILGALGIGLSVPELGLAAGMTAMAMGAQNAVLAQVKGFRAGTTFVTGALFSLGQKIAQALTGTGPAWGWVGDGAVWLALLVGALAGALAYARYELFALVPPALLSGALAAAAGVFALRAGPDAPPQPSRGVRSS